MRPGFLLTIVVAFATTLPANPAVAQTSALDSVLRFFSFTPSIPERLESAIAAWEEGRFFETLGAAGAALDEGPPAIADETHLLRGLALERLGWDELAAESFVAVLEADPPSPYYPLALLELIGVHDRADRPEAVARVYDLYLDRLWPRDDDRSNEIRELLFVYGELRVGGPKHSRQEKRWLANPEELAVRQESRNERVSDRLMYRSAVNLLELGRYRESLAAFRRIGIVSPDYPYALYGQAQSLYGLGRLDDALRVIRRLSRLEPTTPGTHALRDRSRLLRARLTLETGDVDDAVSQSTSVPADGPYGVQAALLRASIRFAEDDPALGLTELRRIEGDIDDPFLDVNRSIAAAGGWAALGDQSSAFAEIDGASARATARVLGDGALAAAGEALVEASRERVAAWSEPLAAHRRRLAEGMRRVARFDGPANLGLLIASLFLPEVPARDLGALPGPVEVEPVAATPAEHELVLEWLDSPARRSAEEAIRLLGDVPAGTARFPERSLRVLAALLHGVERVGEAGSPERIAAAAERLVADLREEGAVAIAPLRFDRVTPLAIQAAGYRRSIAAGLRPGEAPASGDLPEDLVEKTGALVEGLAEREALRFLEARNESLRRLVLELATIQARSLAFESSSP